MSDSTVVAAATIYPVEPILPGPLTTIHRAILARLQLGFPLTRFQYAFMPPRLSQKGWNELLRRPPFIGIGWNSLEGGKDSRIFEGRSRWSIFLATKNQNSIDGRYIGDSFGPGLFTMVQAAVGLLHGYVIKGIGNVEVTAVSNAYAENWDDDAAIAIVDLSIGTTMALPDVVSAPGDLGLFQQLFATWNLSGVDENTDEFAVGNWASPSSGTGS